MKKYIFKNGKVLNVTDYGFKDFYAFAFYLYSELNKILNEILDSKEITKIHSIIKSN